MKRRPAILVATWWMTLQICYVQTDPILQRVRIAQATTPRYQPLNSKEDSLFLKITVRFLQSESKQYLRALVGPWPRRISILLIWQGEYLISQVKVSHRIRSRRKSMDQERRWKSRTLQNWMTRFITISRISSWKCARILDQNQTQQILGILSHLRLRAFLHT